MCLCGGGSFHVRGDVVPVRFFQIYLRFCLQSVTVRQKTFCLSLSFPFLYFSLCLHWFKLQEWARMQGSWWQFHRPLLSLQIDARLIFNHSPLLLCEMLLSLFLKKIVLHVHIFLMFPKRTVAYLPRWCLTKCETGIRYGAWVEMGVIGHSSIVMWISQALKEDSCCLIEDLHTCIDSRMLTLYSEFTLIILNYKYRGRMLGSLTCTTWWWWHWHSFCVHILYNT